MGIATDDGTFWSVRSPIEKTPQIKVPTFVIGILVLLLGSQLAPELFQVAYTPWSQDPLLHLRSIAMPAAALALTQMGPLARMTRSAALEVANSELSHRAFHDALTGLPNRALAFEYGNHLIASTRRGRKALLRQRLAICTKFRAMAWKGSGRGRWCGLVVRLGVAQSRWM